MAQKDTHPYAKPITLEGKNGAAMLLIHGYTGSPTDFNGLATFLHERSGISVFVPLLPGHGTKVEDLRGLTKDDFLKSIEPLLQDLLTKYQRVIVGGHSFGGQAALHLAARFPVHGVFVTGAPVRLAFPLSIPGFYKLWNIFSKKEFLNKRFSSEQKRLRALAKSFSYDRMPTYGLKLTCDMNEDLRSLLPAVKSPLLSIYLRGDAIAHVGSGEEIEARVNSEIKKMLIFDSLEHGVFFTSNAPDIQRSIAEFFEL